MGPLESETPVGEASIFSRLPQFEQHIAFSHKWKLTKLTKIVIKKFYKIYQLDICLFSTQLMVLTHCYVLNMASVMWTRSKVTVTLISFTVNLKISVIDVNKPRPQSFPDFP